MGPGERRAALLLGSVVGVNAAYTVLIPFVQALEERTGAGPAVIAATFAVFAAARTLTQPVGGWWVDRWRPGPVACASMLVCAFGTALTALARDPATLLAGRVVWGVGEGLVCPALYAGMSALCGRYDIPASRMTANFGVAATAGLLLGPVVTGIAAPAGLQAIFLAGAAVTAVLAFGLLRALPADAAVAAETPDVVAASPVAEPTPSITAGPAGAGAGAGARAWWRPVLALGALDMATYCLYAALEPVLPLYLGAEHDESARAAVSTVFAFGLAASAAALWGLGRWADRVPLLTLVAVGLAVLTVALPSLAVSPAVPAVAVAFVVYLLGHSVLFLAARRGIMQLRAAASSQGAAFGLFGMVSDVGNIVGPVVGVLVWQLSGRGVFVGMGALTAVMLAGLLLTRARARAITPPLPAAVPAHA